MKEYRFMKLLVVYYNYLLVLTFLTSCFFWFDASMKSFLQLVVLLVLPYLVSKLKLFLHIGKEKQEVERTGICYGSEWVGIGILASPGAIVSERTENSFLCCILFIAALGVYLFWRYYRGKYLVLYRNPSVSANTRKRAQERIQNPLIKLVAVGAVLVIFIFVVANFVPELQIPNVNQERKVEEPKEKIKNTPSPQAEMNNTLQEKSEEGKENDSIVWLIIRYAALVLIVLTVIAGVFFVLFQIMMVLMGFRRTESCEYHERMVEKTDNEEYSELIPVARKEVSFPSGNDGKVRKLFYRAVRKGAGSKRVENSRTPQELQEKYLLQEKDSELLTELYEKARYSPETVTDEEVSRLE